MTSSSNVSYGFLEGGRYRNRKGEYEVLNIHGSKLHVVYDDGEEAHLDAKFQARINQNMELDIQAVEPYSGPTSQPLNKQFFQSIGFLAQRIILLEAIVHPRAQAGFIENYSRIVGKRPASGQDGYYVHDERADKWGNELRVTFTASHDEHLNLNFGKDVNIVTNPSNPGSSWRINKNTFWWDLLKLGFKMGHYQDIQEIKNKIPHTYRSVFDVGVTRAG